MTEQEMEQLVTQYEQSLIEYHQKLKNWHKRLSLLASDKISGLDILSHNLKLAMAPYINYCNIEYARLYLMRESNPSLIGNKAFEDSWDADVIKRFNVFINNTLGMYKAYGDVGIDDFTCKNMWIMRNNGDRTLGSSGLSSVIINGRLYSLVPPVIKLDSLLQTSKLSNKFSMDMQDSSQGRVLKYAPYLPNGIEVLNKTFLGTLIHKVVLPNTVRELLYTFENSAIQEWPNIPSSVIIMVGTFNYCRNLKAVGTIPGNVKVAQKVFQGARLPGTPQLEEGIEDITELFCSSDIKEPPVIPSTVRYMVGAFKFCPNLVRFCNIPYGVRSIDFLFSTSGRASGIAIIPDTVLSMNAAFYGTHVSSDQVIPNSVIFMRDAFAETKANITNIPESADISFYDRLKMLNH